MEISVCFAAIRNADKNIVIDHGTVAETGRHEQLIAKEGGIYKNLSTLQFELM